MRIRLGRPALPRPTAPRLSLAAIAYGLSCAFHLQSFALAPAFAVGVWLQSPGSAAEGSSLDIMASLPWPASYARAAASGKRQRPHSGWGCAPSRGVITSAVLDRLKAFLADRNGVRDGDTVRIDKVQLATAALLLER